MLWILYTFIPTQNLVAKNLHIDFKILSEIVTIGVCFDGMARGRQSSSPRRQLINNNVIILERILKSMWKFLATKFWVSMNVKSIHNTPNYNPYLHRIFCSKHKHKRHHTESLFVFLSYFVSESAKLGNGYVVMKWCDIHTYYD